MVGRSAAFCATPSLPKPERGVSRRARVVCSSRDLLIVGAGELGTRVGVAWLQKHVHSTVTAATLTTARHDALAAKGFTPVTMNDVNSQYDRVLFCAPPGKNQEYAQNVKDASALARLRFVFTSTAGVYADSEVIKEHSDVVNTERAEKILKAEKAASDGVIIRLAGLYSLERGPHNVWLRRQVVKGSGEGVLNLVHYDDAAQIAISALECEEDINGMLFVAADGAPITRRQVCEAALQHPFYKDAKMPQFDEQFGGSKKRIDCSWTRSKLGWQPEHHSFVQFMQKDAARVGTSTTVSQR